MGILIYGFKLLIKLKGFTCSIELINSINLYVKARVLQRELGICANMYEYEFYSLTLVCYLLSQRARVGWRHITPSIYTYCLN